MKTKKNDVCAIVVTYNRLEKLKRCLSALKDQSVFCDILVINNFSDDGTSDFLSKQSALNENLFFIDLNENIGGAGGFSIGLKEAYQRGYLHFWLMDDDCIANKNALKELIENSQKFKNEYGFLSSLVRWIDGSLCAMNNQYRSFFQKYTYDGEEPSEIIMATFAGLFITRKVVEDVGLPFKDFFIWADDLEYTRRISRSGYKNYVVPTSVIVHEIHSNDKVGIQSDAKNRMWRYKYLYRNEYYIYKREGIAGMIYYRTRVLVHILRVIASNADNKKEMIDIILKSCREGKSFNPEIEKVI